MSHWGRWQGIEIKYKFRYVFLLRRYRFAFWTSIAQKLLSVEKTSFTRCLTSQTWREYLTILPGSLHRVSAHCVSSHNASEAKNLESSWCDQLNPSSLIVHQNSIFFHANTVESTNLGVSTTVSHSKSNDLFMRTQAPRLSFLTLFCPTLLPNDCSLTELQFNHQSLTAGHLVLSMVDVKKVTTVITHKLERPGTWCHPLRFIGYTICVWEAPLLLWSQWSHIDEHRRMLPKPNL